MTNQLAEIVKVLSQISESLKPDLGLKTIYILAPVVSSFIAVLIAYYLDRKSENNRDNENFIDMINYILVKNDLNIRTLFSLISKAEKLELVENDFTTQLTFPKITFFSPLQEIDISDLKLIDIDSKVTTIIFELREISQIIKDQINDFSHSAEQTLSQDSNKNVALSIEQSADLSIKLNIIINNSKAFVIRLVVLSTQILSRAYDKLNKHDRKKLYEIEITDDLVKLIEDKIDSPDISDKYNKIKLLKTKNKLGKSFRGMENKDVLIKIFLKIMKKNQKT